MTLRDALDLLQDKLEKHGNVEVFFDCPHCEKTFAPNTVRALAVHLTEAEKVPDA